MLEALRAGTSIEKIFIAHGLRGGIIDEIRSAAQRANVRVVEASRKEFQEMAHDTATQGVIALTGRSQRAPLSLDQLLARSRERAGAGFLLILDE